MGSIRGRLHLDVSVRDRRLVIDRLLTLGAVVDREADGYTVLLDPEGNPFCLVESR